MPQILTGAAIRAATPADARLMAALHAPAFPKEPWPADAMATMLESPGVFGLIIAAASPGPAPTPAQGFILCRMAADEGEVLTLAVLPEMRRRGLGARLLERAQATLATCGITTLFLEVAEDNPAALALYQGSGFTQIGRRPHYYQRGAGRVAALVLSCPLARLINPLQP